jgi:hypothetical protein
MEMEATTINARAFRMKSIAACTSAECPNPTALSSEQFGR